MSAQPQPIRQIHRARRGERGTAIAELALVMPLLLLILLAVVDFGHLIQTRLIVTNVSREGGSIGCRELTIEPGLLTLLAASGRPLELDGPDGRIVVTRIRAGESAASPDPQVVSQLALGGLGAASGYGDGSPQLGLSQAMFDHLTFDDDNGTADISEVTVVEVIYRYRPITPLPGFMGDVLTRDGGGIVIRSRSVF